MQIFLILALLIAILAVIFAVQNVAVVTISFFAWSADVSLAVALLLALAAGVLITVLLSIPGRVKGSWNSAAGRKKFAALETERDNLKLKIEEILFDRDHYIKKLEASEQEIAGLEEELASLSAALQEVDTPTVARPLPPAKPQEALPPPKETDVTGEKPVE